MLIRVIEFLVGLMVVLTMVRSVVGFITKMYTGQSATSPQQRAGNTSRPQSSSASSPTPAGGELKKDPVCGTFISTATAFQTYAGGQTHYFCSTKCRDKFTG